MSKEQLHFDDGTTIFPRRESKGEVMSDGHYRELMTAIPDDKIIRALRDNAVAKQERQIPVATGYEPLYHVLMEALDQAQSGKGAERHANGLPFLEQPIFTEARECGTAFLAGQARKKIREALHCADDERAIKDWIGAIVYTAAMVIERRL